MKARNCFSSLKKSAPAECTREAMREMLADQQGLLQQKQADKIKLVQKHEEEKSKLAKLAQLAKLKLANKQKNEMEKQQLETILEIEKLFDKLTITTQDTGDGSKKAEELEKKSKKVEELELKELEKDQEVDQETMNTLVRQERESNDEIVDARKTAVEVMEALSSEDLKKLLIQSCVVEK